MDFSESDIFQEFCLKVSEDLFYRTPPCVFVISRLCRSFVNLGIGTTVLELELKLELELILLTSLFRVP